MGKKKSKSTEASAAEADAAAGLRESIVVKATARKEEEEKGGDHEKETNNKPHNNNNSSSSSKRIRDKADGHDKQEVKLSRRQKRQKLNEKNKWPQHPKITNPEKRVKAYLRVAGIEEISEDDTEVPTEPPQKGSHPPKQQQEEVDDDDEWRRFGRFLGGTDARTRHKAVKRLGHYLKAKSGFGKEDCSDVVGLSELDLLKLWKGLWYTLYMADKAPVQDELAKHLSKLIWCLAGPLEEDERAGQAFLDWQLQEELEMEQQMAEGEADTDGEGEEELELEQQMTEVEDDGEGEDDEDNDSVDHSDEDFQIFDARFVEMEAADGDDDTSGSSEGSEEEEAMLAESNDEDADPEEEDAENKTEKENPDENEKAIRGAPLVMLMIKTFFHTLVREWGKMDKYRVDKFYTLMRYMMREIYRYMATRQWNLGIIKLFNDTIVDEALCKPPNGIRYHLIDVALAELSCVVHKTVCLPLTEAIFLEVMEPFLQLAQHGAGDKTVQARAMENILEKFLKKYSVVSEISGDDYIDEKNKSGVFDEVHVGTVAQHIFEMASDEHTSHVHRKSLYDMHKQYKRQLKEVGRDVELGDHQLEGEEHVDEDEEDSDFVAGVENEGGENEVGEKGNLEDLDLLDGNKSRDEEAEQVEKLPKKSNRKKEKKEERAKLDKEVATYDKMDTTKSKKGKKEGKRKSNKKDDADEMQMDWTHHGDGAVESANETKAKSERRKQVEHVEETVTISVSDQKRAKNALKKPHQTGGKDEAAAAAGTATEKSKKQKKKGKGVKDEKDKKAKKDVKRRVSWDNKEQARSWKASMQGLRTMKPALLSSKTPDKSILLNKGKKSPANTSIVTQKHRKRAIDYF